jgi:peptide/nickel transport system permease protein
MRHQFGLDQPLWVQYGSFVASFLTGDLGQSFYYRTPVLELTSSACPTRCCWRRWRWACRC